MRLHILFFGVLRDRFGEHEDLEQFPGQTVDELLHYYRVVAPEVSAVWDSLAVAVNQHYAGTKTVLADGDEVALLPPVSGGTAVGARDHAA